MNKVIEEYGIPVHGLKERIYEYDFVINQKFFEFYQNPDYQSGSLEANIKLIYNSQVFEMRFNIKGWVDVICDRCLEMMKYAISVNEVLYFKYGSDYKELDDNVIIIPRDESKINIAQYLYEFIVLNIPYRKLHPVDEKGISGCNPDMIKKLSTLSINE